MSGLRCDVVRVPSRGDSVVTQPVMLHYGNVHHAHKVMAKSIDAELISVPGGDPLSRIITAKEMDLGDRPVVLEGGRTLFEAAWMKRFGNCGVIIHLASDETLMNVVNRLEHYSNLDRLVHFWCHRYVDGAICISPRLETEVRAIGVKETKIAYPTTDKWRYEMLQGVTPDFSSNRILGVGSNRKKSNFQILPEVRECMENDVVFDLIGPETDNIDYEGIRGHGFVDQDEFEELFGSVHCFVLPGYSHGFAVSVTEAMLAGLPAVTTDEVGAQYFLNKIHPKLVQGVEAPQIAEALDWILDMDSVEKMEMSQKSRGMARLFTLETMEREFVNAYDDIVEACS